MGQLYMSSGLCRTGGGFQLCKARTQGQGDCVLPLMMHKLARAAANVQLELRATQRETGSVHAPVQLCSASSPLLPLDSCTLAGVHARCLPYRQGVCLRHSQMWSLSHYRVESRHTQPCRSGQEAVF